MSPDVQERSDELTERTAFGLVFLIWVCAAFFCVGEAFWRAEAPGSPLSEAPGHLWLLARACEQFFSDGPVHLYLDDINHPAGLHWVLMDPINTIWGLPAYYLGGGGPQGAIWAAHSVILANLALAAGGAYCAGRYFGGTRASGVVCAAALCLTPPLLGLISSGYSEKYPVGWMGFHYVALDLTMRRAAAGADKKQIGWPALAAVFTGIATCYAGWYMTVVLWLCSGVFVLYGVVFLRERGATGDLRTQRLRVMTVTALVGSLILLALLPLIQVMHTYGASNPRPSQVLGTATVSESGIVEAIRGFSGEMEVHAKGFEAQQMLPYFNNISSEMNQAIDPFLGAWVSGLLLLVVFGIWRSGVRPQASSGLKIWVLLSVFLALLMMGHQLVFRGTPVSLFGQPVWLPVHYLTLLVPELNDLSFWGKFSAVLALHIGVVVAIVVGSLSPLRARTLALFLPALLVCETMFSTGYVPFGVDDSRRNSYSFRLPVELKQALQDLSLSPDEALLQLPMDNEHPALHGTVVWPFSLWQIAHGQPIAENNLAEDSVLKRVPELIGVTRSGRRLDQRVWQRGDRDFDLRERLLGEGFGAVVLHLDRILSVAQLANQQPGLRRVASQSGMVLRRNLLAELGDPTFESKFLIVWKLKY